MKLEAASPARNGSREADPAQPGGALTREDRALLLRYMLLMRTSEERGLTLYRQGKVPGSPSGLAVRLAGLQQRNASDTSAALLKTATTNGRAALAAVTDSRLAG